jgi:hypothetical protein
MRARAHRMIYMCTVIPRRRSPPYAARRSRRRRVCVRVHTRAPTRTLECILRMRAYVRTRMHELLRTHICALMVPSRARLGRVLTTRPTWLRRIGGAGVSAAAAALTVSTSWATRPPPAAPRARCWTRPCAPTVRPRRAAPGPPRTHAGRPRAPAMRARGSAAADDRQRRRRRRRQRRGMRPGTHMNFKSLHWPSHSGSAFTFVPETHLPHTARACGPRPPYKFRRTDGD